MSDKITQNDLITLPGRKWPIGDQNRPLLDMVKQYLSKNIIPAPFQRSFVWSKYNIAGWIDTIENNNPVGVLTTYQLMDGGSVFLADGYQRINATIRYLESPNSYGKSYGSDQAERYTNAMLVAVQHRHHESHQTALYEFQNLNRGTACNAGEYFKGMLTLANNGEYVYKKVPETITKYESPYIQNKNTRYTKTKLLRDSFALYYQFITKSKSKTFWDAASNKIDNVKIIEKILADHIMTQGIYDINKDIARFENFIASHYAHLDGLLIEANKKGEALSYSVNRWFVHFHIWCNNEGHQLSTYEKFVKGILPLFIKPGTAAYFYDGDYQDFIFRTKSLGNFEKVARHLGIEELADGPIRRKKNIITAPGYDEHHIEPFSIHGNGKTIAIPSIKNRSIGNKENSNGHQ